MFSYRVTLLIVLFGSSMWGIYWVPLHLLEAAGYEGPRAGLAVWLGALPFLLVLVAVRKGKPVSALTFSGALIAGIGIGMWGASIAFTDVVRSILLFYLLPVWSTAIECVFMGRRFTLRTLLAVCCSLLGIVIICRGDIPLAGLGALGDWLALIAGALFAIGMAIIFRAGQPDVPKIALGTVLGSLIAAGVCVWLFLPDAVSAVPAVFGVPQLGLVLLTGLVYAVPLLLISMWSVTKVSPANLSFVMTSEVIVGVATSAVFLDQLFGWPEIAGTVLIVLGGVTEVIAGPNFKPGESGLEA